MTPKETLSNTVTQTSTKLAPARKEFQLSKSLWLPLSHMQLMERLLLKGNWDARYYLNRAQELLMETRKPVGSVSTLTVSLTTNQWIFFLGQLLRQT